MLSSSSSPPLFSSILDYYRVNFCITTDCTATQISITIGTCHNSVTVSDG